MKKKKSSPVLPIVGCLVIQLCVGIIYLWSVMRQEFPAAYSLSPESSIPAMVASYMLLAFVVGNLVGGYINDKKGPRFTAIIGLITFAIGVGASGLLTNETVSFIILTYCVIAGLGSGIAYGACISCVQKWLPHRRGLASGLAVSAFGLSTVVFATVINYLMDAFRGTDGLVNFSAVFFTLAGIFFVLGIIACMFVHLPDSEYLASLPSTPANAKVVSSNRDYTLGQAMRTVPFWCMFLFLFFINGTWNLTSPLIRTLGESERGLTSAQAVFAVSFTGITNAVGRLSMATLSDKIGRFTAEMILCFITFAGAILMTFISGIPYIAIVALVAFGYGGPSAINPAISTDFFGQKNSGTDYGIIMLGLGISSVVFNAISTKLLHHDPLPSFIMGAATAVLAAVMMCITNIYLKRLKTEVAH